MQCLATGYLAAIPNLVSFCSPPNRMFNVNTENGLGCGKRPAAALVHCLLLADVIILFCG